MVYFRQGTDGEIDDRYHPVSGGLVFKLVHIPAMHDTSKIRVGVWISYKDYQSEEILCFTSSDTEIDKDDHWSISNEAQSIGNDAARAVMDRLFAERDEEDKAALKRESILDDLTEHSINS